jgi:hypothetical protein
MRQGGFAETPRPVVVGMLCGRRVMLDARSTVASAAQGSDCHMRAPPDRHAIRFTGYRQSPFPAATIAIGAGPRFDQRGTTLSRQKSSERLN